MEFFIGMFAGFMLTVSFIYPSEQDIIEKFQQPQCIEKIVGLHEIKKCYVINEVEE
jgi:hypothetical protein